MIYPTPKYDFRVISLESIAGIINNELIDIIANMRLLDNCVACSKKTK